MHPDEVEPNGEPAIEPTTSRPSARPGGAAPGQGDDNLISLVVAAMISTYLITHSLPVTALTGGSAVLLALRERRGN